MVQDVEAQLVLHRHDGFGEALFLPGLGGALLAFHGIAVDIIAGETVLGRDQVGGDALGHDVMVEGDFRIGAHGPAIGAHRHARHGFDTAANGEIGFAGHDFRGRHVHGFQAGGAETVELIARRRLGIVRIDHGGAGNVRALLTHRRDHAHDDVVHEGGVEIVAVPDRLELLGGQLQRGDLVERSVLLLAARRARGVVNIGFGHVGFLSLDGLVSFID